MVWYFDCGSVSIDTTSLSFCMSRFFTRSLSPSRSITRRSSAKTLFEPSVWSTSTFFRLTCFLVAAPRGGRIRVRPSSMLNTVVEMKKMRRRKAMSASDACGISLATPGRLILGMGSPRSRSPGSGRA